MTEDNQSDPNCSRCGRPKSEHGVDPRTLEPTKCPVNRQASTTPPQERATSPRSDY